MRARPAQERILEALLSIPDAAERLACVDDALTPPPPGAAPPGDDEDELLFTTPLKLLRVIDLTLQRVRCAPMRCACARRLADLRMCVLRSADGAARV